MTITWEHLSSDQRGIMRAALRRNIVIHTSEIDDMLFAEGLESLRLLETQHISMAGWCEYAITEEGRALVEANPYPAQLNPPVDLVDYRKKQLEQIWKLARVVPTDLDTAIRVLTNIAEIAGHEPETL